MKPIYLDFNATTPIAPEVVEEMLPFLIEHFGNPSSGHYYGQVTKHAVAVARKRVANLLGCSSDEIIFTSGGSESDNLALRGIALANKDKGNHIITVEIEHPAILATCMYLEKEGFNVTYLPVDRHGMVSPEDVFRAITSQTILISVMHASNEVGTIQPLSKIGEIARSHGIYVHTDAAQSAGKIPTMVEDLQVDLLTLTGHKFYGPKGMGALYIRRGTVIEPLIYGASQERGFRAGTENVANIVALGKACHLALQELPHRVGDIIELRDYFYQQLQDHVQGIKLNGHPVERLPNTLNVSFEGINGAELLELTPEIAASTGSACHHGSETMSPVLAAMGLVPEQGFGSVRFSLGRGTTRESISHAVMILKEKVEHLRR
jgi:cysteine desulfurase